MSERRKWILGLLAAFLFGTAGGALGAIGAFAIWHHYNGPPRVFVHDRFEGPRGEHGGPGERRRARGFGRPSMERVVMRHLDLSPAQRDSIEAILDAARPRYAAIRESTRAEIDRLLTPEQRERMKEFEARFPAPSRRSRGGASDRGAPGAPGSD